MNDEIQIVEPENGEWQAALAPLRPQLRDIRYILKAKVALDAGLYDAAVNYIWDLVINDLRMKIEAYGVEIFNSVEEDVKYKFGADTLSDRWHHVPDSKLLSGCLKLNIIGRTAFRHLSFWLSVRHHESAAHPVQEEEELDGEQALFFIRECVRYVLSRDVPAPGFNYGEMINAVKSQDLTDDSVEILASFEAISQEQANNVLGMFVEAFIGGTSQTKTNIQELIGPVWERSSESAKGNVGQKYAKFSGSGDIEKKSELFALLVFVGGVNYIPNQFLGKIYQKASGTLIENHFSFNNFNNEISPARQLAELGSQCPNEALPIFIEAFLVSYIGNRYGRSTGAYLYLERLREEFGLRHYHEVLNCIRSSNNVQSEFLGEKPFANLQRLMEHSLPVLVTARDKEDAEFIINNERHETLNRFANEDGF